MDADTSPQVFTPFSEVSFEDLASTDPLKQIPALHKLIYEQCNGKECSYYIDTLHKVRADQQTPPKLIIAHSRPFCVACCYVSPSHVQWKPTHPLQCHPLKFAHLEVRKPLV